MRTLGTYTYVRMYYVLLIIIIQSSSRYYLQYAVCYYAPSIHAINYAVTLIVDDATRTYARSYVPHRKHEPIPIVYVYVYEQ